MKTLKLAVVLLLLLTIGAGAQTKPAPKPAEGAKKAKEELLDLNTCPREQLVALPGVGETYADKIVAGRPYKRKDELVSKSIVPAEVYKKFSAKVIARKK